MNIQAMPLNTAKNTLALAYKALALLNKLRDSAYRTRMKSRTFSNINRLRAHIKRLEKAVTVSVVTYCGTFTTKAKPQNSMALILAAWQALPVHKFGWQLLPFVNSCRKFGEFNGQSFTINYIN